MLSKKQMKRIVLAVNASYLLAGAETDCVTSTLSDSEIRKYERVQAEVAYQMLRRAGFAHPMSAEEILAKVLAEG